MDRRSLLEVQLETLAFCGIAEVTIMVGFGAEAVSEKLESLAPAGMRVRTQYNPVHAVADNLLTAWLAREHLRGDVLLLNGDTLFEAEVVRRLLGRDEVLACAAIHRKPAYDADDMKVTVDTRGCIRRIGKGLNGSRPEGEAIGLTRLRGAGAEAFQHALERAVRQCQATRSWYTAALQLLAQRIPLESVDISGLWWSEIDDPDDLASVRAHLETPASTPRPAVAASR